jgi:hypothetical protein
MELMTECLPDTREGKGLLNIVWTQRKKTDLAPSVLLRTMFLKLLQADEDRADDDGVLAGGI